MHYLVTGCCGLDDVPLKMFTDRQEAERYADSISREQVIEAATNIQKRDVSHVIGVDIYTFDNDGDIIRHQPCFKDFM